MHRSITLVHLQLDAQNSYLFTYNTFIKILYMLRASPRSSSGGLRRNCIYAASGIVIIYLHIIHLLKSSTCFEHYPAHLQEVYVVTVHLSSFLTGAQDSHLQTVTIPETAYIQLRRRPPEYEQGNARNM